MIYYEDLFSEAGLRSVCNFLEIDILPADFGRRINESKEQNELCDERAKAIFDAHRPTYLWAAERDVPLPHTWRQRLEAFG